MEYAWEREYCHELHRKKRRAILERAIETEGMSPANELRMKLLEARYGKSKEQKTDYFLRGLMTLKMINAGGRGFFAKKRIAKDREAIRMDWKLELADSYGEIGKKVLYQEFCNVMLLYLKLCNDDRNYNSTLLGIGRLSEETLANKIGRDLYTIAYEYPEELGLKKELASFTEAAKQMFFEKYPDAEDVFGSQFR